MTTRVAMGPRAPLQGYLQASVREEQDASALVGHGGNGRSVLARQGEESVEVPRGFFILPACLEGGSV